MNNRVWLLRTFLISSIVAVAVYAHGLRDQTIVDRFSRLAFSQKEALWSNQWLGVPTWQNPNDAWIIQEIISEVSPDYIVEAGTFYGGSALLWATVLREINPAGKVITIDIEDRFALAKRWPIAQERITFILGSSTDPKIVGDIARQVKGKRVLVILDSNHSKDHVLKELESYGPMVNVGSYIVVQDSNVNGHPVFKNHGPGPMEAIEAYLSESQNFEPDQSRERLLYTTNPRGYLRRVK